MKTITPASMGQLMMRDMLTTIYLGELLGLGKEPGLKGKGYFNQPSVQLYKDIMGELLGNPEQLNEYQNRLDSLRN